MRKQSQQKELVGPWRSLHGAVWLIGLAILFWKGSFWPGILILVAISMALEGIIMVVAPHAFQETGIPEPSFPPPKPVPPAPAAIFHRTDLLPSACPKCGAPVRSQEVRWTGAQTADCSYCGSSLPMNSEKRQQ